MVTRSSLSGPTLDCAALLFDLDGVLVDSRRCVERHWRRWAGRHGLEPEEVLRVAWGRRTVEVVSVVAPHLDAAGEAERLSRDEAGDPEGVESVPGADRLLRTLAPTAWAVVTSGTAEVALGRIRHTGLPLPRVLVAAGDVTHGKPHPDPYVAAAGSLGVPPADCLVLEDTAVGIAAALAAGMPVLAVASTYGPADLAGATMVVDRLGHVTVQRTHLHGRERFSVGAGAEGRYPPHAGDARP